SGFRSTQVASLSASVFAAEVKGSWKRAGIRPIEAITSVRKRAAASRASQLPGVRAATRSASAASFAATPAGMRGSGGGGSAFFPSPQPASSSALETVSKAVRQPIGQPPLANLFLGAGDVVLDPAERCSAGLTVEQQPGRARVTVGRLADRAGVEQPPPGPERRLGAGRGETAVQDVVLERDRERHVAVTDEQERRSGQLERHPCGLRREHVLPHRVTRAPVEQLDPVALALWPQRLQERP